MREVTEKLKLSLFYYKMDIEMFTLKEKVKYLIMAVLLIVLLCLFKLCVFSDHTLKANKKSYGISYTFAQRKKSETWNLAVPNHPLLVGSVYESKIDNHSGHNITNWSITLKIKKKCYLSSCWNGTVEIFQKNDGKKIHQPPVKLLNRDYEDLKQLAVKKFCARRKPLLIYLSPGDKVIYYPDTVYNENFVPSYSGKDPHPTDIGFVFFKDDSPSLNMEFDFADAWITYSFKDIVTDNITLYVIIFLFLVWVIGVAYEVKIKLLSLSEIRDREHDKQTIEQVMTVFTKFIDAKDIYTGGHSERVASYARLIAMEVNRDEEFCQKVYYCGLLHDCGKISINDAILGKAGNLSEEEFLLSRNHTKKGYELLKSLSSIPEACLTALHHHERYDGTGYPEHLTGKAIPETARIIAVADSFDSMNSSKYYRKGLSKEKIISEFKENSGTQFDPEFVDALLNLIEKGRIQVQSL